VWLVFAICAVASSAIATRVLFGVATLATFQVTYGALFLVALAIFGRCRLVSRYTQLFDRKWVKGVDASEEPLLGTGDIQSLADLGNSDERIDKMRVVPIELRGLAAMVVPGAIPAIPLAASVMPGSEIVKRLLRLLA
jgi:hypothetical protein